MGNERLTEEIIRTHIKTDTLFLENKLIYEEQSSKNIRIDKLLKNASKFGLGRGFPEFIIQYTEIPNFIIVVECKAEIKQHESPNKNQYKDFAVDGVLLYTSFLSKEYDVLAIAISGKEKTQCRISHFLQLKGTDQAHPIFQDEKLLSFDCYLEGYQKDEKKFNQDFQELLKYSKELNDKLHSLQVVEAKRSLLISGVLIALSDKAFETSYQYHSPKILAENLLQTIKHKLSSVQTLYIEAIMSAYSFIKTHTLLSSQENVLRDLLYEIDIKINSFIRTYQYFDTLGQFYIEFLRYANNDKKLGIVLTPPHITELFCEIANVNKESIVLDTCTGTGGFLISAMKRMLVDAAGDREKERTIKATQIIGIELNPDIFSLLCSNMYIHGDGRSNLLQGSCFDPSILSKVTQFNPNVGFLNPPYKVAKTDKDELEFILNTLNLLEKGAYCIAIVPTSCMLYDQGYGLDLKQQILKNHTLDAVFTMSNELFYNSEAAVSTCVVVFKAKEKHRDDYKTYFGLWNEDGFVKIKNLGRIDYFNKWSSVKDFWMTHYINRDEVIGHSVKRSVSAKDEWVVEAYVKINYSNLAQSVFETTVRDYVGNLFCLKKIEEIKKEPLKQSPSLINIEFQEFKLIDLATIFKGERLTKTARTAGEIPLLTSSSLNNGISSFINEEDFKETKKKFENKITVDMLANTYFHGYPYYSDDNIHTLVFNDNRAENPFIALYISTILKKIKLRYTYGRQVRLKRLKEEVIQLPVDSTTNEIAWDYMEHFIQSLPFSASI